MFFSFLWTLNWINYIDYLKRYLICLNIKSIILIGQLMHRWILNKYAEYCCVTLFRETFIWNIHIHEVSLVLSPSQRIFLIKYRSPYFLHWRMDMIGMNWMSRCCKLFLSRSCYSMTFWYLLTAHQWVLGLLILFLRATPYNNLLMAFIFVFEVQFGMTSKKVPKWYM